MDFSLIIEGTEISRLWFEHNQVACQPLLESSYKNNSRPLCMCMPGGIEMYIAPLRNTWVLCKMPGTGYLHHPECISFETDTSCSGKAWYSDQALRSANDSVTVNFLDKSLDETEPGESHPVRKHVVSIKGVLCLLLELAAFNQWAPQMQGKRSWGVLRHYLQQAADKVSLLKYGTLSPALFIPKQFNSNKVDENLEACANFMANPSRVYPLFLIAEIKSIEPSPKGYFVVLKNMHKVKFFLPATGAKAFEQFASYSKRIDDRSVHMLVMMSIRMLKPGLSYISGIGIQMMNDEWIPIESFQDYEVLKGLLAEKRKFLKPLRFDMPDDNTLYNTLLM